MSFGHVLTAFIFRGENMYFHHSQYIWNVHLSSPLHDLAFSVTFSIKSLCVTHIKRSLLSKPLEVSNIHYFELHSDWFCWFDKVWVPPGMHDGQRGEDTTEPWKTFKRHFHYNDYKCMTNIYINYGSNFILEYWRSCKLLLDYLPVPLMKIQAY